MAHRINLRARPEQHFIYSGRSLLITNLSGEVPEGAGEGFYVENTRLLSRSEVRVNGELLRPVAVSPVGGHGLFAQLQIPEKVVSELPVGETIPERGLYIEQASAVGEGLRSELLISNYHAHETVRFDLAIHLAADFADINETKIGKKGKREQTAEVEATWDGGKRELLFRYLHPQLHRAVAVRIDQSSSTFRYENGALVSSLELQPQQSMALQLVVEPVFDGERWRAPAEVFGAPESSLERLRQRLREEVPRLTTTNTTVAQAWRTATEDLASLPLGLEEGPATPIAGVPLYQQFFGRDSLTIAWQAALATPIMLHDTLQANAAWQGTRIDDWYDEEPGKMIHQARRGPLSVLGLDPLLRYYGDYATPPDFLIMLGQYLAWTNDLKTVRELLPAAREAITWLERYADLDGDGFIEYVTRSEKGVKNQGWKDAPQSIVDERGELVENPIAPSELQAYWYVGLRQAAFAFFIAGDRAYAVELLGKARALKRRFNQAFWMEDEGFYALGLGPDKRQIRAVASNAGHLLATGIVPPARGRRVARRLMQRDLFSGWGVRTLPSSHPAYNPFSYHLGSVWTVDSGTFALGFGRYGCWEELHRLAEGLFAATDLFVENRLPEVIGGLPRDRRHPHPGLYPESNEPQGWSASAVVMVLQALLGLRPLAPLGLLLIDPHLPPWLPELRLEGVRVGRASVDLQVWRTRAGETRYRTARREGKVRVLRQPPLEAPDGSIGGRVLAGLESFIPR